MLTVRVPGSGSVTIARAPRVVPARTMPARTPCGAPGAPSAHGPVRAGRRGHVPRALHEGTPPPQRRRLPALLIRTGAETETSPRGVDVHSGHVGADQVRRISRPTEIGGGERGRHEGTGSGAFRSRCSQSKDSATSPARSGGCWSRRCPPNLTISSGGGVFPACGAGRLGAPGQGGQPASGGAARIASARSRSRGRGEPAAFAAPQRVTRPSAVLGPRAVIR
jgi:hypothetical protein